MKKIMLGGVVFALFTAMIVKPQKKVVFFGDSITEAGVTPGGYISLMKEKLSEAGTAERYDLLGAGVSGNKIYDLHLRLQDDVLAQKPKLVVIYIGVNDVWHKSLLKTGTDADKFERFYLAIIKKLKQAGSAVVLCTPAAIGEQKGGVNPMDGDLDAFSNIIRKLASQEDCKLVDLRKLFTEYSSVHNIQNSYAGILTTDGVHLNAAGNALVAKSLLQVLP